MHTDNLIELFYGITSKFSALEKKQVKVRSGMGLTTRELHTIDLIGRNPGINVTKLARIQGITKGAVSQMITKLCQKHLVSKTVSEETVNEVCLTLKSEGLQCFEEHNDAHKDEYELLSAHLDQLTLEQHTAILNMLKDLDQLLENKL